MTITEPVTAPRPRPTVRLAPLPSVRRPTSPPVPAPRAVPRASTTPRSVVLTAVAAAVVATIWSAATHSMLIYGDARAHLNVARHVTDGLQPGFAQLGSVWLPLPHVLLVPLVALRPLWHSGVAGALVGGACFVYAAVRVYGLVQDLTASRVAAWWAFVVFAVNLNMLYVQSTALTEPVLLACVVGAVFHLSRWMRSLSVRQLWWAGVLTFCATLTRYEGWALLATGLGVVLVWSRLTDRRHKSPQANLVLFAVVGSYGVALWFLYNLIIFGDALYFLHSAYSAQAINGAQAQFGLLGTKGDLRESLLTYGWDVALVVGPAVVAMSVVGLGAALTRRRERRRTLLTLALLAAPVAFELVSLFVGQTTIRVPQRPPFGMWNDRYGLMALPLCAVAVGVAVKRWRVVASVAAAAVVLTTLTMAVATPLTLADGRTGTSSATAGHPETVAAFLRTHYRGGRVLADDSVASPFMFAADLDLKEFVTVGFHPFWEEALAAPADHVAWAVAVPGDAIATDMAAHPDRFAGFRPVLTDGRLTLYQRQG